MNDDRMFTNVTSSLCEWNVLNRFIYYDDIFSNCTFGYELNDYNILHMIQVYKEYTVSIAYDMAHSRQQHVCMGMA